MVPPSSLVSLSREWHPCWSHCGRRVRLQMIPPSSLVSLQEGVARPSFTARIGRAQFHRARSASKKDSRLLPPPVCEELETVCETRRTKASFTGDPGGLEDGWSSESVRVMPFYCSKRSASICVVLGPKKSSTYSSGYASGFFEPAPSHLPAAHLLRNEGLLGQTPNPIARRQ